MHAVVVNTDIQNVGERLHGLNLVAVVTGAAEKRAAVRRHAVHQLHILALRRDSETAALKVARAALIRSVDESRSASREINQSCTSR